MSNRVYKFGDKFLFNTHVYVLAYLDGNHAVLISLHDGNRWRDPVQIDDISGVTADEFKIIVGRDSYNFEKLTNREFVEIVSAPPKPTYKFGQKFINKVSREEYILVRSDKNEACLVSLADGNRWRNAITVKRSINTVDFEDFLKIIGENNYDRFELSNV